MMKTLKKIIKPQYSDHIKKAIIFLILIFASPPIYSQNSSVFVRGSALYHTEPISYQAFTDDWDGDFSGGRKALAFTQVELGSKIGDWEISLFQRSLSYLTFDAETAEIVYLVQNRLPLEAGRRYKVDLTIKSMQAEGVRLGHQIAITPKLQWRFGASILSGKKILDGRLVGYVDANSEKDYSFDNIELDYFYSKDKLFNHEAKAPGGYGFSMDTQFNWKPNEIFFASLFVGDIFGFIDWKNAPKTVATIESDNKKFDDNGYVKIEPLLSGNQSTKNYRQYLPLYSDIKTETKIAPHIKLLLAVKYTTVKSFAEIGLSSNYWSNTAIETSYLLNVQALSIAVRGRAVGFQIASDNLAINQARYFNVNIFAAYLL